MDLYKVDIVREHLENKGWSDRDIDEYIQNENIEEAYYKIMEESEMKSGTRKIKNCLRAYIIGDALGVPFEFKERGTFNCTGFVGGGSHQKEAGTWSDDTSVMLCLLDALNEAERIEDAVELLKKNLVDWYYDGKFTADGDTFDVGRQTAAAIECDFRNYRLTDRMGNGALFYTPIVFYFLNEDFTKDDFKAFCKVTHNNLNCFDYGWKFCQILKDCVLGKYKEESYRRYSNRGDVVNTFMFVLDFFNAQRYRNRGKDVSLIDCLCEIVNRGGDTDTNAALLGLLVGTEIEVDEKDWEKIRNHELADSIIDSFCRKLWTYIER